MLGLVRSVRRARPQKTSAELVACSSPTRWAEACTASGQPVTPLHSWTWLSVAAEMTGREFRPLVLTAAGHDLGVVPVLLKRQGPLSTIGNVPFPYCGPLVGADALPTCLDLLRSLRRRTGSIRTRYQFPPTYALDPDVLRCRGYEVSHDETYLVDTSGSVDRLSADLEKACRKRMRRAERAGIVVTETSDGAVVDQFHESVYGERGVQSGYLGPLAPYLDRLAGDELRVRSTVATQDGTPLGALVSLAHGTRALTWMGGVLPAARETDAGVLLYWDALTWANTTGVTELDLLGLPNDGIRQFKRQFGGTLQPYAVAEHHLPGADLVDRLRQRRVPSAD